jgi:heterodisulfide reductase subunit C
MENLKPEFDFIETLEEQGLFQAQACFQCRKCSNGCPLNFAMDLYPDQVIRLVLLGQKEQVLKCRTIWICSGCETCTTRCPNEVKIAELMDRLKEWALRENIPCPEPPVLELHRSFLKNIGKRGRVFESTLLPDYLIRSGQLKKGWKDGSLKTELKLGGKMFLKGRMPLRPSKIKNPAGLRKLMERPEK